MIGALIKGVLIGVRPAAETLLVDAVGTHGQAVQEEERAGIGLRSEGHFTAAIVIRVVIPRPPFVRRSRSLVVAFQRHGHAGKRDCAVVAGGDLFAVLQHRHRVDLIADLVHFHGGVDHRVVHNAQLRGIAECTPDCCISAVTGDMPVRGGLTLRKRSRGRLQDIRDIVEIADGGVDTVNSFIGRGIHKDQIGLVGLGGEAVAAGCAILQQIDRHAVHGVAVVRGIVQLELFQTVADLVIFGNAALHLILDEIGTCQSLTFVFRIIRIFLQPVGTALGRGESGAAVKAGDQLGDLLAGLGKIELEHGIGEGLILLLPIALIVIAVTPLGEA